MKLRKKFLASLIATVLVLTMMVGAAYASTDELPFVYGEEAGVATNNDVWVVLFGGTAATPMTDDEAIRDSVVSVDVVVTGNCSFNAELIGNTDAGWLTTSLPDQTVDGELALDLPFVCDGMGYCEVVVNLKDKTEGALAVSRLDFKDADGNVVITKGEAAAAEDDVPKTGVVTSALLLGLGAAAFGTGAVVLKKKER